MSTAAEVCAAVVGPRGRGLLRRLGRLGTGAGAGAGALARVAKHKRDRRPFDPSKQNSTPLFRDPQRQAVGSRREEDHLDAGISGAIIAQTMRRERTT